MAIKDLDKKIKTYALKNSLDHNGKAQSGSVISALFHEGLKKEDVKKYIKKINLIIQEINSLSIEEQKKEFENLGKKVSKRKVREGLPELPDVKKSGVRMRLAPSASGPLHVMHAINGSLSYNYVRKYGGKMIVRIEDTNPENIDKNAYKLIKKDVEFLFNKEAEIFIQSDRIEMYYDYARKLIKKDSAYVCTCSSEEFKKFVFEKKNCPCRKFSIKENIERWENMLTPQAYPDKFSKKISTKGKKGYAPGEAVLRFKSDMKNKNPAMRDFPLARINLHKHPRQKNKFRVWPLMNLSVAVDDMEMKMTHIIRGKDHRDNAQRQKLIFEVFGKKYPYNFFLGRYHFKDLELSTSKFREGIEKGIYSGWDDPKLPTVISLKKRGYKAESFWKMAEHIGLSEVDKTLSKKDFFISFNLFNK